MKPIIYIVRLCLGAAICGTLAGILGGAVVGVVIGLVAHNAAFGLDGALWGGAAGAGLGALYGLGLAIADSTRHVPGAPSPNPDFQDVASSQPIRAVR